MPDQTGDGEDKFLAVMWKVVDAVSALQQGQAALIADLPKRADYIVMAERLAEMEKATQGMKGVGQRANENEAERLRLLAEKQRIELLELELRKEATAREDKRGDRFIDSIRAVVASSEVKYILLAVAVWALTQLGIQVAEPPSLPTPE